MEVYFLHLARVVFVMWHTGTIEGVSGLAMEYPLASFSAGGVSRPTMRRP